MIISNINIILIIKAEDEAQQSSKRKESSDGTADAAKGEETAALEGDPPSKRPKL